MQSHVDVPPKASKKRFLKKIIFSSGVVGLVGLVGFFTKTYQIPGSRDFSRNISQIFNFTLAYIHIWQIFNVNAT